MVYLKFDSWLLFTPYNFLRAYLAINFILGSYCLVISVSDISFSDPKNKVLKCRTTQRITDRYCKDSVNIYNYRIVYALLLHLHLYLLTMYVSQSLQNSCSHLRKVVPWLLSNKTLGLLLQYVSWLLFQPHEPTRFVIISIISFVKACEIPVNKFLLYLRSSMQKSLFHHENTILLSRNVIRSKLS